MCAQLDARSGEAQRCAEDAGMETRGAAAAHWQLGESVCVCVCAGVGVCECVCGGFTTVNRRTSLGRSHQLGPPPNTAPNTES